jgi:hypothetical protein
MEQDFPDAIGDCGARLRPQVAMAGDSNYQRKPRVNLRSRRGTDPLIVRCGGPIGLRLGDGRLIQRRFVLHDQSAMIISQSLIVRRLLPALYRSRSSNFRSSYLRSS